MGRILARPRARRPSAGETPATAPVIAVLVASLALVLALPQGAAPRVFRGGPAADRLAIRAPRPAPADQPGIGPARGRLLVASRGMADPNFAETVILLLESGPEGAMGLVVNRPAGVRLADVLPQVPGLAARPDELFAGGPVETDRLFVLLRAAERPPGADLVAGDLYLGATRSLLERLVAAGSADFRAFAGYAGWGPAQLEGEIAQGDWRLLPADPAQVLAGDTAGLWRDLIARTEGAWARASARASDRIARAPAAPWIAPGPVVSRCSPALASAPAAPRAPSR